MHNKNEDQIRKAYQKDTELQKIQNALQKGEKAKKGIALGLCQRKDGHIWYGEKIWIPEDEGIRTTILSQCHDNSLAGHGGTAKTTELVSQQYYSSAKVHICLLYLMRHQGYRGAKYKTLLTAGRYTVGTIPGKRTEIR